MIILSLDIFLFSQKITNRRKRHAVTVPYGRLVVDCRLDRRYSSIESSTMHICIATGRREHLQQPPDDHPQECYMYAFGFWWKTTHALYGDSTSTSITPYIESRTESTRTKSLLGRLHSFGIQKLITNYTPTQFLRKGYTAKHIYIY